MENSDGDYADCYVTVTGEGGVEEIELSDESLTLYVGEGYELERPVPIPRTPLIPNWSFPAAMKM